MAIPAAVVRALPAIRRTACSKKGRKALRQATAAICTPPDDFFGRGVRLLGLSLVGGPFIPWACARGGPDGLERSMDVICDTPPQEVVDALRQLEQKLAPPELSSAIDGFFG